MKIPYRNLLLSAAVSLGAMACTLCSAVEILTLPLPGFSPKIEGSFGSQPLAF
jgi:hypothetical protein